MDLGHTIISMNGSTPARVICRTCKSEHNFKAKRGVKEPGAAATETTIRKKVGTARAKTAKPVSVEVEWNTQMNDSSSPLVAYAADQTFKRGDRIGHPTFGEGIVQKTIHPNKIEILFRTDLKILVHSLS